MRGGLSAPRGRRWRSGDRAQMTLEASHGCYWATDTLIELGAWVHLAHPRVEGLRLPVGGNLEMPLTSRMCGTTEHGNRRATRPRPSCLAGLNRVLELSGPELPDRRSSRCARPGPRFGPSPSRHPGCFRGAGSWSARPRDGLVRPATPEGDGAAAVPEPRSRPTHPSGDVSGSLPAGATGHAACPRDHAFTSRRGGRGCLPSPTL